MSKAAKVKVRIFETVGRVRLEALINAFIEAYCLSVTDIKFRVDYQVDPGWEYVVPMYSAMIIYEPIR